METVEGGAVWSDRISTLVGTTRLLARQQDVLRTNWYQACFDISRDINPNLLGQEKPLRDLIPHTQELGGQLDSYYSVNWLIGQFHNNWNIKVDFLEGNTDPSVITIALRSIISDWKISKVRLVETVEVMPNNRRALYRMVIDKPVNFRVDNTPEIFDEFFDLTKVSEVGILQFSAQVLRGYHG